MLVAVVFLAAAAACQTRLDVDGARALARVQRQVQAGPRVPGTPAHDSIRVWIEGELARLGAEVETQKFVDSTLGRPLELTNLVGRYGPNVGRRVALIAHWDSRPWCDQDPDSTRRDDPVPGANDGGSGVAVLLEVAELLAHRPPAIGVDLVFVDGEDLGTPSAVDGWCRGSKEFARRLRDGRTPEVAAAFVFDMVGDRDLDIHPVVRSAERSSNLVQLVLDGAHATGARHFYSDPRWDPYDDHVPLLEVGVPAVDIIDFDYSAWHTSRDLPDQVSAASLAEVARVAAWIVYQSPLAHPRR
jgi:Zn-dependent M28 family amino/carboxypeptidase